MAKWPKAKVPLDGLPVLSLRRFIKERCGPLIGDGLYRDVYEYKLDPRFVVKIERDPSNPELLRTERGAGYVFMAPVSTMR